MCMTLMKFDVLSHDSNEEQIIITIGELVFLASISNEGWDTNKHLEIIMKLTLVTQIKTNVSYYLKQSYLVSDLAWVSSKSTHIPVRLLLLNLSLEFSLSCNNQPILDILKRHWVSERSQIKTSEQF